MRTPISLALLLLALLPFTITQASLASAIEQLPTCALKCLTAAIAESPCSLADQKCICTNVELQSSVELCVLQSCTTKEALTTKNVTMTTCGAPIRDRSGLYSTISTTLAVISAICVLLRIIYKLVLTMSELGLDDCFIFITLLAGVPSSIISVQGMAANGLGRDVWTLKFEHITNFARWFYVMEVLYFAQVTLLKISLLFFYARIFPGRPVRRVIWATIAFNITFGSVFCIVGVFQCRPVSYYWTMWDGEHTGTCININALGWANAAISIALDLWMLAIPLSQLVHLKLAWKKKVGVALMFCVGTFVTVVSILRLQTLVHFANSSNQTMDQWDISTWSTVEINVGIMCACMPAIRVILVRLFPKILGSTRVGGSQYYAKQHDHESRSRSRSRGPASHGISNASQGDRVENKSGVITYTKTFDVQHADHDETRLVQMDDLSPKASKMRSNSSEISL